MFINIYLYIDLEIGNVDYVFIFIDIDMVTLEINSESMFISIVFKKTLKNTNHCVSTDLSVFDCIPITVCLIYSLAAGIILFKKCEFGFFISLSFIVFHQSRGTFTGVSEEGTPNLPFAKAT